MHTRTQNRACPFNPEAPLWAPATAFPGRLPTETQQALKSIDPRLELRWSPRFECWEVWHERGGLKYVFYRHVGAFGSYLPADLRLVSEVLKRSMTTKHGQEAMSRMRQRARDGEAMGPDKDFDEVAWKIMARTGKDPTGCGRTWYN